MDAAPIVPGRGGYSQRSRQHNTMARGVNKVILIGNLGEAPELRYTGDGTAVCNMRIATNESYTDSDGEEVQKTDPRGHEGGDDTFEPDDSLPF